MGRLSSHRRLALHEWFTQRDRPVPRFLFLDQPSKSSSRLRRM
ncbi:DUF3732 domain-containing protein [Halomonas sp.]